MIYVLLAVFVFILISLQMLKSPKVKGRIGESSVRRKLRKLDSEEYKVLHDLMIRRANGRTSQIDHVVISRYGVFVIETKNYKGWIMGSEKSEYWTQVLYRRKERLYSPIRQNYGHIKALEEHLQDGTIPFVSIVAFTARAELKLKEMTTDVVYATDLAATIQKYKDAVLSDEQVRQVREALSSQNIHALKERKKHVSDIKQNLEEKETLVNAGLCPRCKSKLVERQGKNGPFTGCSSFPKCRYTKG